MKLPRTPKLNTRQKILAATGSLLLIGSLGVGGLRFYDSYHREPEQPADTSQETVATADEPDIQPETDQTEAPPEAKPQPAPQEKPTSNNPIDDPASIHLVVNKTRPLNPKTYVPANLVYPDVPLRVPGNASMKLRSDTAAAAKQLFDAAAAAGYSPLLSSGYRSYSTQTSVYNGYVASDGQAAADTYSARPGYSEHQTGLAFDICNSGNCQLEESFASTPLGQWVASNAHKYGFTIRYHQGKQHITGYTYEPWHLRYVGTDLAASLYQSGKTLEEHFGLPAAPDYQ